MAENLSNIIKEVICLAPLAYFIDILIIISLISHVQQIRVRHTDSTSDDQHGYIVNESHGNEEASLCVYFMKGSCNRGSQCLFSHSAQAKRDPCKFFFTLQVFHFCSLSSLFIFYTAFFFCHYCNN